MGCPCPCGYDSSWEGEGDCKPEEMAPMRVDCYKPLRFLPEKRSRVIVYSTAVIEVIEGKMGFILIVSKWTCTVSVLLGLGNPGVYGCILRAQQFTSEFLKFGSLF